MIRPVFVRGITDFQPRRASHDVMPDYTVHQARELMTPEIRELEEQLVVCITRRGYNGTDFSEAAQAAFAALGEYLSAQNLWQEFAQCVALCPDDPTQVEHTDARYQAGAILKSAHEPQGEATI